MPLFGRRKSEANLRKADASIQSLKHQGQGQREGAEGTRLYRGEEKGGNGSKVRSKSVTRHGGDHRPERQLPPVPRRDSRVDSWGGLDDPTSTKFSNRAMDEQPRGTLPPGAMPAQHQHSLYHATPSTPSQNPSTPVRAPRRESSLQTSASSHDALPSPRTYTSPNASSTSITSPSFYPTSPPQSIDGHEAFSLGESTFSSPRIRPGIGQAMSSPNPNTNSSPSPSDVSQYSYTSPRQSGGAGRGPSNPPLSASARYARSPSASNGIDYSASAQQVVGIAPSSSFYAGFTSPEQKGRNSTPSSPQAASPAGTPSRSGSVPQRQSSLLQRMNGGSVHSHHGSSSPSTASKVHPPRSTSGSEQQHHSDNSSTSENPSSILASGSPTTNPRLPHNPTYDPISTFYGSRPSPSTPIGANSGYASSPSSLPPPRSRPPITHQASGQTTISSYGRRSSASEDDGGVTEATSVEDLLPTCLNAKKETNGKLALGPPLDLTPTKAQQASDPGVAEQYQPLPTESTPPATTRPSPTALAPRKQASVSPLTIPIYLDTQRGRTGSQDSTATNASSRRKSSESIRSRSNSLSKLTKKRKSFEAGTMPSTPVSSSRRNSSSLPPSPKRSVGELPPPPLLSEEVVARERRNSLPRSQTSTSRNPLEGSSTNRPLRNSGIVARPPVPTQSSEQAASLVAVASSRSPTSSAFPSSSSPPKVSPTAVRPPRSPLRPPQNGFGHTTSPTLPSRKAGIDGATRSAALTAARERDARATGVVNAGDVKGTDSIEDSKKLPKVERTGPRPRIELAFALFARPILRSLLPLLDFSDFSALHHVSRRIKHALDHEGRELVLERFLGAQGYRTYGPTSKSGNTFALTEDLIVLDLRDLRAFRSGLALSHDYYSRLAKAYISGRISSSDIKLARATTRAWNRVVLRLRSQQFLPPTSFSPSTFPELRTIKNPAYKTGRAPNLRVWVPTAKGDSWMSDTEIVECEREIWRSGRGVWGQLKMGDVVSNVAIEPFGNCGRTIYDGRFLRDLAFSFDVIGHLPNWLNMLSFSPSYYHNVLASSTSNPVFYLALHTFVDQLRETLKLDTERVSVSSPQGNYMIKKHLYRGTIEVSPNQIVGNSAGAGGRGPGGIEVCHPDWSGRVTLETEGTSEYASLLIARVASVEPTPWRIIRERCRPGRLYLKPVLE